MKHLTNSLTGFLSARRWHERHLDEGGEFFPTYSSLIWFIRTKKLCLLRRNAILVGQGSRPNFLSENFDRVAVEILMSSEALETEEEHAF